MTIYSMTGFGRSEIQKPLATYRCEIKTLNARYLDVYFRLPRSLIALEPFLLDLVKKTLGRGKVEVTIDMTSRLVDDQLPQWNESALSYYGKLASDAAKILKRAGYSADLAPLNLRELLQLEGVVTSPAADQNRSENHQEGLGQALEKALQQLIEDRCREGTHLSQALTELLRDISESCQLVKDQQTSLKAQLADSMRGRLGQLMALVGGNSDIKGHKLTEERLIVEICLLQDKADITEEVTRLDAHLQEFHDMLAKGGRWGRKLDFLCQELLREVNTISSKVGHLPILKQTVGMKHSIEQLRQQVQNIE